MTWLRRALTVLALLIAGLAVSSSVQPAFAVCEGDPPVPAKPGPYEPRIVSDEDPFSGDASIESVYGTTPQLWNYDNGCSPGSGIMPGVGAALANLGFEVSGAFSAWTHALLEAVISPEWARPLDAPVAAATRAVADGTWTPWLVVALTLVAVMVLLRSREGHLSGAITATVWALVVLVAASWVMSYPTESVRTVDHTVRSAVVQVGNGFTGAPATGETDEEQALGSVDQQMDAVVRTVQYRTWLRAVFGDPNSEVAQKYGPDVFRATHFTWAEWEEYQADPDGEGKELREKKQERFKDLAEEIKDADPVAYEHFTGGDWGSRISASSLSVLVMTIVCAFLLVAGLTVLAAFAVIRLLVPFTPALGVVFLLDLARERAIEVFRRVGGVLVMGPIYFVAGLVLLRFYGELLTADMPFLLSLAFILALSVIAWRLLKPGSSLIRVRFRGLGATRRYMRRHDAAGSPVHSPSKDEPDQNPDHASRRGPVYSGQGVSQSPSAQGYRTTAPTTFVERRQSGVVVSGKSHSDEQVERIHWQPAPRPTPRHEGHMTYASSSGHSARAGAVAPARSEHNRSTVTTGSDAAAVVRGAGNSNGANHLPTGRVVGRTVKPDGSRRVNEANLTSDEHGNRVFVVYTPDEETR